jgi:hypothetical protein
VANVVDAERRIERLEKATRSQPDIYIEIVRMRSQSTIKMGILKMRSNPIFKIKIVKFEITAHTP